MTTSAIAAVAHTPQGRLVLENVELDTLAPNEVLVRVEACGICHTDSKFQSTMPLPGVFGHEGVGYVEKIGRDVTKVCPGDRVVMSYPFCTTCPQCVKAVPYNCEYIPKLKFGGSRFSGDKTISLNGKPITSAFFQQSSFASHAITLEHAVVQVDKNIKAEMLAALPCGVQTGAGTIINSFKVSPGDSVIIFGAGTVGLSAVMAARLSSAYPIICVDMNPGRLELAKELGATHVFDVSVENVPERVMELTKYGVKYAFDSSASVPGLKDAIKCICHGGHVGIVSYPLGGEEFPFSTKELFIKVGSLRGITQGSSVPREFIPKLIDLNKRGLFPYEKLISTYKFSDINKALADVHAGTVIKPVVLMDGG